MQALEILEVHNNARDALLAFTVEGIPLVRTGLHLSAWSKKCMTSHQCSSSAEELHIE